MNPQPNPSQLSDDDLQQLLLELHYGLLEDQEASELRHSIATDSHHAALWAQTLQAADKIACAATVPNDQPVSAQAASETGSLDRLSAPQKSPVVSDATELKSSEVNHTAVDHSVASSATPHESADLALTATTASATVDLDGDVVIRSSLKSWLVYLAVAVCFAVVIPTVNLLRAAPEKPHRQFRVAMESAAGADSTTRNRFYVTVSPADQSVKRSAASTGSVSGLPLVPASISFRVLANGAVLFRGEVSTEDGQPGKIVIPDSIAIPSNATLHIDASPNQDDGETYQLEIPLEPTRCLTFLSTDRPVYRPGESIYFRSVTLNRQLLPLESEVPIRYELYAPDGSLVSGSISDGVTERGVGNGQWVLSADASGGTYILKAKSLDDSFPEQSCQVEVRRYRAVKLKTDLEFKKRSFAASDPVKAELSVRRADDSIPAGAAVEIKATLDGATIYQSSGHLDTTGEIAIEFSLPETIVDGKGTLAIVIHDGAVTETAARPIPVHTGKVQVDFFPEGGYLVGGLANRVFFTARDTDGKPIEIKGDLLSQSGHVVAKAQTVRDGMGRFAFKPQVGQRYQLRITSPQGITEHPWMQAAVNDRPVLDAGVGVFGSDAPLELNVRSTRQRTCIVRAVCRGDLIGVQTVDLKIGDNRLVMPVRDGAAGVVRVTVLDTDQPQAKPLVERLVFRRSDAVLKVTAHSDDQQSVFAPGQSVAMTINVTDQYDQPVSDAVLGVRVVDDAALSLQTTETASLATYFMLTSEIEKPEDLEHANFYLDDSEEATFAVDLLLGTQGWRRFVSGSPDKFDETFRAALIRLLKLNGPRHLGRPAAVDNAASLSQQWAVYHQRAGLHWEEFVRNLQLWLALTLIAWLIAFACRPRRSVVTSALLLMICVGLLLPLGCAAQYETASPAPDDRATESAADQSVFLESEERTDATAKVMPTRDRGGDNAGAAPADPFGPLGEMPSADSQAGQAQPSESASEAAPKSDDPFEASFADRVINLLTGKDDDQDLQYTQLSNQQLRQLAEARGIDAQQLADRLMEEMRFPIRQYSHLREKQSTGVRSDFAETLCWNPLMVTDARGTAVIRFDLPDSISQFKVAVDAHSATGQLGSGGGQVMTKIPLQIDAKLPVEVTAGDRIDLPIGLVNGTSRETDLQVKIDVGDVVEAEQETLPTRLAAGDRKTEVVSLNVLSQPQVTRSFITLSAAEQSSVDGSKALSDTVRRSLRVVPVGFPFERFQAGSLQADQGVVIEVPGGVVDHSLAGTVNVYPSTRSQLSAGLESILRTPHGCFEQTSASNYPNVMALQLMLIDGTAGHATKLKALSLLRRGYQRLISYECSQLGFEWFGHDPGHEALSAFGLMQFTEMASLIDVDQEMLQRTRKWLLSRRDGQGNFQRNPRHLHSWSASQELVNAYILWALSSADLAANESLRVMPQLKRELTRMKSVALESEDAYLIGLSAITLGNQQDKPALATLLKMLSSLQQSDGSLEGQTTITNSGGRSRIVETTAIALMAFMQDPAYYPQAKQAAQWLIDHRQGGGFGSTQATVLALKALTVVHKLIVGPEGGSIDVLLAGETVDQITWQGRPGESIRWEIPRHILAKLNADDQATLQLRSQQSAAISFDVTWTGRTTKPQSDPGCPLVINVSLGEPVEQNVRVGEAIDVVVEVANGRDQGLPMSIAVIGLPGGLEPVNESLDQLKEAGEIDYYERRGREIVFYWRSFDAKQHRKLRFATIAQIGGRYAGPPSRTYLYYTAESKQWHQPLVVQIK